jgi:sec-independent protein translocase protein TatA
MQGLGWQELLIVLAIVVVIFGVGRIGKLGEELGKGVRAFRQGVREGDEEESTEEEKEVKDDAES